MTGQGHLSGTGRLAVLTAAFAGLLFDGMELGLMPIASLSVTRSLSPADFSGALAGLWFARFTASLMFGAALGGIVLGGLGDRIGRTRAMGISVLVYSIFAGAGLFVRTLDEMLWLRFLVGLGVGGVWPNAVALVAECWPKLSRPFVAGILGAGLNIGILLLSQVARIWRITPDHWRWLFGWSALPAILGIVVLWLIPESPRWRSAFEASSGGTKSAGQNASVRGWRGLGRQILVLFRRPFLRLTLIGIALGSIPMIGAWASSKWMIPWADQVAGASAPGYKAVTQGYWALGAAAGSFAGAPLASWIGRRLSYFLISFGSTVLTCGVFLFSAPLQPAFLWLVLGQGFVATLFFGWLPLCLPELFPVRVRATGSGISYNTGRFATGFGVLAAGALTQLMSGNFAKTGAILGLVYAFGMVVIWWAPCTSGDLAD